MSSHIMDKDLEMSLELIKDDVHVKHVTKNSTDLSHGFKELVIERHKLESCPDPFKLINMFEKKIVRTNILKSYRYTRQLCILLMTSSGYSVNSSIFNGVTDIFIEKCWECIQYISYTIDNPLRSWLSEIIGGRNPPSFSALFCPPRQLPERVVIDDIFPNKLKTIEDVEINTNIIPKTIWHRDDIVMHTILNHMRHQTRSSSPH